MHILVCLHCWQREIHRFAVSSFVPFEQSYFNPTNLAGALSVIDAGIPEDGAEMEKELRQVVMRHTSQRCEYFHYFVLLFIVIVIK